MNGSWVSWRESRKGGDDWTRCAGQECQQRTLCIKKHQEKEERVFLFFSLFPLPWFCRFILCAGKGLEWKQKNNGVIWALGSIGSFGLGALCSFGVSGSYLYFVHIIFPFF